MSERANIATMKLIIVMVGLMAQGLVAQEVQDIRRVNGIAVDLAPIHHWIANGRRGERPMKHWKDVQILEYKGKLNGLCDHYSAMIDGAATDIIMEKLPSQVTAALEVLKRNVEERQAYEQQAADLEARNAKRRWSGSNVTINDQSWRPEAQPVSREYIAMVHGKSNGAARVRNALLMRSVKERTVLAMFTGKIYAGAKFYDCGLP